MCVCVSRIEGLLRFNKLAQLRDVFAKPEIAPNDVTRQRMSREIKSISTDYFLNSTTLSTKQSTQITLLNFVCL